MLTKITCLSEESFAGSVPSEFFVILCDLNTYKDQAPEPGTVCVASSRSVPRGGTFSNAHYSRFGSEPSSSPLPRKPKNTNSTATLTAFIHKMLAQDAPEHANRECG